MSERDDDIAKRSAEVRDLCLICGKPGERGRPWARYHVVCIRASRDNAEAVADEVPEASALLGGPRSALRVA